MKLYTKYVKVFDTLMVGFSNKPVTSSEKKDNKEILFNDKEIIGVNIFNPQIDKDKKYLLEDSELSQYCVSEIKDIIKIENIENQFVVAKVEECEPIEGTHLSLCKVNDGKELIQIVCGAKNVRKGSFTCLATIGSFMPNGMQILKGKLKGFESFGMLCSLKELGYENPKYNNEGIVELEVDDSQIGKSVWEVL
ncbi:putative tRNA-binding protein [Spiroplasma chinense]|uniref:Putative tRNA-binding protein n=1 Tax=Spiroplasma chinense TaxID=216932 RepID=A0A5B9Y5X2_9MOLU|nr:hypothetical protein [Spiroplasma chinense]QEH62235.1 putative tRNA-binding protein [Spiroplasma chinense]